MALPCMDIMCTEEDSDCSTDAVSDTSSLCDTDAELEMLEEELRKPVEGLLEDVVRYQSEQNNHRLQLEAAHLRYRQRLEQTSGLYEAMRAKHGSKLDKAKAHSEARRAEALAVEREEAAVRLFSIAAAGYEDAVREVRALENRLAVPSDGTGQEPLDEDDADDLASAVAHLARCAEARDHFEEAHTLAVQERRAAEASTLSKRFTSSEALESALQKLEAHQAQVATEQQCIELLVRKVQGSKDALNHSMRKLERISESVHEARAEHKMRVAHLASHDL